jgi:hypothetical protein
MAVGKGDPTGRASKSIDRPQQGARPRVVQADALSASGDERDGH